MKINLKNLVIALALLLISSLSHAGGGGKTPTSAPTTPQAPQTPQTPDTAAATSRERTRRAQGGGNQSTVLTGPDGANVDPQNLNKPALGFNTVLGA